MIEMYLAPELTAHGSVVTTTRGGSSAVTMEQVAGVFSKAISNTESGTGDSLTETSSETKGDDTTAT